MTSDAKTPEDYINNLPEDRKKVIEKLRETILKNLPSGFVEMMSYGMIGFVVPHKIYPQGYHCNPKLPLPFINIASQKNFIAIYHSGMYANKEILDWFVREYSNHTKRKLDMGKSCIRFKKPEEIPYKLIGELAAKMTPQEWIHCYEKSIKKT